jgi:hypothetical protein
MIRTTLILTAAALAVVSGSGDISYAGNPQVTRNVSGSGDISHR